MLQHVATRAMTERGLLPAFSGWVMADVRALPDDGCRRGVWRRERPRPDAPAVGIDRQRQLARSRPAVRGRGAAGRRHPRARGDRGRGRTGSQGLRDRRARAPQHHVGLHRCGDIPHAAGAAVHGPHVAERLATTASRCRGRTWWSARTAPSGTPAVYRARVRNQAKLAYDSTAAWLDGQGPLPPPVPAVEGLADNLRLQDDAAQRLRRLRRENGALSLQTVQAQARLRGRRASATWRSRRRTARRN